MTRFTDGLSGRLERDLTQISDQASPSSTAWEAIQHRIDEQDSQPNSEPTMEVIMLDPDTNRLHKRPRTGLLVAASIAALALIGGLVVLANRDDVAPPADLPEPTVPSTEPIEDAAITPLPSGDEITDAPVGVESFGVTRFNAVEPGDIADIGEGYRLQVLSVTEDATAEVLDRFESIDPPPDGSRYSLVSLAGGYYGLDDPQERFSALIRAVDFDTGEEFDIDEGCGDFPQFPPRGTTPADVNVFAGGVQRGELCVVVPEDNEGIVIQAFGGSSEDGLFLMAVPRPDGAAPVAEMTTLAGIQSGTTSAEARRNAIGVGMRAEVGDAGWVVAVTGPAVDITDVVLAQNPANPAPADGYRFIGVPMSMEHASTTAEAPLVVNVRAVGDSNVEYRADCGVVPDALDLFAPVTSRSPVVGQLCFVVPTDEVDSMTVYAGSTSADVFFET